MFVQIHPQPVFPVDAQNAVVGNSSASLNVAPGFTYKISVSEHTYIKLSKGAATATTSDMLVFGQAPSYLFANGWDTISFVKDTTAGQISIVRVQNPI